MLNKRLKEALAFLGSGYSVQVIDFEQCLYRNLGDFDFEISGVKRPYKGNICNVVYVWDLRNGSQIVEKVRDIKTLPELQSTLNRLCKKYGQKRAI